MIKSVAILGIFFLASFANADVFRCDVSLTGYESEPTVTVQVDGKTSGTQSVPVDFNTMGYKATITVENDLQALQNDPATEAAFDAGAPKIYVSLTLSDKTSKTVARTRNIVWSDESQFSLWAEGVQFGVNAYCEKVLPPDGIFADDVKQSGIYVDGALKQSADRCSQQQADQFQSDYSKFSAQQQAAIIAKLKSKYSMIVIGYSQVAVYLSGTKDTLELHKEVIETNAPSQDVTLTSKDLGIDMSSLGSNTTATLDTSSGAAITPYYSIQGVVNRTYVTNRPEVYAAVNRPADILVANKNIPGAIALRPETGGTSAVCGASLPLARLLGN